MAVLLDKFTEVRVVCVCVCVCMCACECEHAVRAVRVCGSAEIGLSRDAR